MENTIPLKIKTRDVAIGFFGWIIFHNLLFYFSYFSIFYSDREWLYSVIAWLIAVIAPLVLYKKKQAFVSIGVLVTVIINTGAWLILEPSVAMAGLPFPLGIVLFMQ